MAYDFEMLDGKILCDEDGKGVLVTKVSIVEETFGADQKEKAFLSVEGIAKAYLKNPDDPDDGVEPLADGVPVRERMDLETDNRQQFLSKVARHFKIPDLKDTGSDEDILRLVKGGDDFDKVSGRRVYFKFANKTTDPRYPKAFTNFYSVPKREEATRESTAAVLARIRAKKEAANDI
jgi:hypothetical protein